MGVIMVMVNDGEFFVVVGRREVHHQNCLCGFQVPAMRARARLNKEIIGATHGPTDRVSQSVM
jgi:hypothetical protein